MGSELLLTVRGRTYRVEVESLSGERAVVRVDGEPIEVDVRRRPAPAQASAPAPAPAPAPVAAPMATGPSSAGGNVLTAVMPGVVTRILVKPGQEVKVGEVLLILEAMKMENEIRANRPGRVERLLCSEGKRVQTGEPLLAYG